MKKEDAEAIAFHRYGMIHPIIAKTHGYSSVNAYLKHLEVTPVKDPITGEERTYAASTVRQWLKNFQEGDFPALYPGSRSDSGATRILNDRAKARIQELIRLHPKIFCTDITEKINEEQLTTRPVSVSTVTRYVNTVRKEKSLPQIHQGKDRKAFEMANANDCWQADTTELKRLNGKRTFLVMIIDDASRLVVGYQIFFHDNKENFQIVLKRAVETYGAPKLLYTDHGGPYENRQLELICARIGTLLRHPDVRDGAAKGKIERLNKTVQGKWMEITDFKSMSSLEQLNRSLSDYIVNRYNRRPHSALKQDDGTLLTPLQRFLQDQKKIRKLSQEELDHRFLNCEERKVRTDSTISIRNSQYEVPEGHLRETIQVLFDPSKPEELWMEDPKTKEKVLLRPVNKVENASRPRSQKLRLAAVKVNHDE